MRSRLSVFLLSLFALSACLEPQLSPDFKGVSTDQYTVEILAEGLASPWSVAEIADGYLLTSRDGRLYKIGTDGNRAEIKGLPDDIYVAGQGGLFDVIAGPGDRPAIYLAYAKGSAQANGTAIYRGALLPDSEAITGGEVIFQASPLKDTAQHFGAKLALDKDQILLTTGDGFTYREAAQDQSSDLGKIIRIDNGAGSHISFGHRNVQGLAIDSETGALWSHEHGPRGGDELNLITKGGNYGWPMVTKGLDYNGAKITPLTEMEGTIPPVHSWVPSIAPSGLVIYRGDMFPEWNGDALVGGLASHDIRIVDLENGQSVGETIMLGELDMRVRDIRQASDGALLVVLDDPENGKLIRLSRE